MKPKIFRFETGSWDDLIIIEYQNGCLCKGNRYSQGIINEQPSKEKWDRFTRILRDLKVDEWKEYYDNPGILDGHQWGFKYQIDELKIDTVGTNGYPGKNPQETVYEIEKSLYMVLEREVDELSGGELIDLNN